MKRQGTSEDFTSIELMRVTGFVTVAMSVIVGLVAAFALPSSGSAIAGILILFSGTFLIIGITMLVLSLIISRRRI